MRLQSKWVWSSCSRELHKEVDQKTVHDSTWSREGLRHLDWWVGHPVVAPPLDRFLEEGNIQEVGLHHQGWKGRFLGGGSEEWVCPQHRWVGDGWPSHLCMEVGRITACWYLEHNGVGH